MSTSSRSSEHKQAGLAVARILLELKAVDFNLTEPYTLTGGWMSPAYVDCRKVISYPRARRAIVALAVDHLRREVGFEQFDAVAGGETAGIPYAAWVAEALDLPMLYVRKQPKKFGRMTQVEGDLQAGWRVLLVEDLITDGRSKVDFARTLRAAGGQCHHALVPFFYGIFTGALKALEAEDLSLHFLCMWRDVMEAAESTSALPKDTIHEVRSFLLDPRRWSGLRGGRAE